MRHDDLCTGGRDSAPIHKYAGSPALAFWGRVMLVQGRCLSTAGATPNPRWLSTLLDQGLEVHCGYDVGRNV